MDLLKGKTIQQITNRVNWTLLPDKDKIPFKEYKKQAEYNKTEIQMNLPTSAKVREVKKKHRPRHYSVIDEEQYHRQKKTRRSSVTNNPQQPIFPKPNLCYASRIISDDHSPLIISNPISPRMPTVTPSLKQNVMNGGMNNEIMSVSTETNDMSLINTMIQENTQLINRLQTCLQGNIPLQGELFVHFVSNLNNIMKASQNIHSNLPFFKMQVYLPQEVKQLGINETIQTPSVLNWDIF